MSRADWDAEYGKLSDELDLEERQQTTTSAVIAGRLSMILEAERGLKDGLTLAEFVSCMQQVVRVEVRSGEVNASTFKLPKNISDLDDRDS